MRKVVSAALAATGGLAMVLLSVAPAWAAPPPTVVSPAGDYVNLLLPAGTFIHESVSGTDTACKTASKPTLPLGTNVRNQILTTNNPTASGPVAIPLNRLNMTNCTTSAPGVTVTVTNTAGWKLLLQHKNNGDTATIKIPKGGSTVTATLPVTGTTCTGIVAPDGPVNIVGRWTDGNPSRVTIVDAAVPAHASGSAPCPNGAVTGSISVIFRVTNASDPSATITVG